MALHRRPRFIFLLAAGLIFAGGIEAPAIDAPPDFLFQTCGDTVGNVLNGDGGKAEGTGKPG